MDSIQSKTFKNAFKVTYNSITLKSNSFGNFFCNGNITTRNTLRIPSQTAQSTDSNFKKQSSSIHNKRSKINKGVSQERTQGLDMTMKGMKSGRLGVGTTR
eukprot:GHVL01027067.1.p1 GENE.GHVL01027067.1~~GHVL01027067.1.p1  ORF type:complete len:101 (-),score=4.37 GHVL01027067.1:519-821(-)